MLLLSIGVCLILGRQILLILTKQIKSPLMRIVLSFGLGTGVLSFLMFLWGLFNISYSFLPWFVTILAGIGVLIMFSMGYRPLNVDFKKIKYKIKKFKLLEWFLIVVILFQLGFVFFQSIERPISQMDSLTNWSFKAKTIFLKKQGIFQKKSPWFLGAGAHPNYPMHLPLLLSWSYFWMGEVNDALIGGWFFVYFLMLILFIYYFLKRFLKREYVLGLIAFLSSIPLLVYHGFVGYADLALSFYFTLGVGFLNFYLKTKKNFNLILSGIFSGFCIWTKNEGLILFGALIISYLIIYLLKEKKVFKNIKIKKILYFLLPTILISLPWLIFKSVNKLGFNNLEKPLLLEGPHLKVLPQVFHQIFIPSSLHIWPGIFILGLLIFAFKFKRVEFKNWFLVCVLFLAFFGYIFIYTFTHSYQFVIDGTIVGRNMITILPISIMVFGVGFSLLAKRK